MITASDWKPRLANTLQGFLTLTLSPPGIVLKECGLHERDGKRWIGLPARAHIDSEGRQRTDPVTGKKLYLPVVELAGKDERVRFQREALAAVDRLLGKGSAP